MSVISQRKDSEGRGEGWSLLRGSGSVPLMQSLSGMIYPGYNS